MSTPRSHSARGALPPASTAGALQTYRDQSAAALRLRLYAGALSLPGVACLSTGVLRCGARRLVLRIIGASHWLSLEAERPGGETWHELMACVPEAPGADLRATSDLRDTQRTEHALDIGWHYAFVWSLREGRAAVRRLERLEARAALARSNPEAVALEHRFPRSETAHASGMCTEIGTARTVVIAHRTPTGAVVETAHVYPNENRAVFSSSRFAQPVSA